LVYDSVIQRWKNTSVAPGALPVIAEGRMLVSDGSNYGPTPSLFNVGDSFVFGSSLDSAKDNVFRIGDRKSIAFTRDQVSVSHEILTSGSLPIGTYSYKILFLDYANEASFAEEVRDVKVLTTGQKVRISFDHIPVGCESILVLRSSTGTYNQGLQVSIDSITELYIEDTGSNFTSKTDITTDVYTSVSLSSSGISIGSNNSEYGFSLLGIKNRSDKYRNLAHVINMPFKATNKINTFYIESNASQSDTVDTNTALELRSTGALTTGRNIALHVSEGRICVGNIDNLPEISLSLNTKPFLPPKFTTVQLATIASAMVGNAGYIGAIAFNTTNGNLVKFNGTNFVDV
jgi:hypothetical protein